MAKNKDKELHQVWLRAVAVLAKQEILPEYPDETVASYGFPTGRNADDNRGACYKPAESGRASVILIHPAEWSNARDVIRTFLHEAIHAILQEKNLDDGHGESYGLIAERIGLFGDLYDTPNQTLEDWIAWALSVLPKMPSDPLGRSSRRGPQKGRMKLFTCTCGFKIRCGRKDLKATCNLCNSEFKQSSD